MKNILRRAARVAALAALVYLVVVVIFLMLETGLVYPAPPLAVGDWNPTPYGAEEVNFESADSIRLHGWYLDHPAPRAHVLFCHGNGEHVGVLGEWADRLRREQRVAVFIFDYRGYGRSQGEPYEQGVLEDGEAALQWLAERAGIPAGQTVLYGRSLGGGVAVHLASVHGARGLILDRTFDSLVGVAANLYRWLPVRLVMRNRYASIEKIPSYRGPLLQLHGTSDVLVPLESAQRLYAAASSTQKRFVAITGMGHNDFAPIEYDGEIDAFLGSLSDPAPPHE